MTRLEQTDKAIYDLVQSELRREQDGLELIPSENHVSEAVLEAQGSVLTNKYAEGLPGKRYYGGCEYVDGVEQLAIDRVKKLFNAPHANVQPHSGAQANMAVYFAALNPGDTILGMRLDQGGHLTHGSPVSMSGKWFKVAAYGVTSQSAVINYNEVNELAKASKPKLIIAGASSYSRIIDFERFRKIADGVGALFMADIAHIAGLVVAGLHPSPFPHAHFVTTTTHKTLRGPRAGVVMCQKEFAAAIDKAVFPGIQGGPLMHIIAAKAVAFHEAMQPEFVEYQRNVVANANALAKTLQANGCDIVSGGTDNHLLVIDLRSVGLTGKRASLLLQDVGLTVNKNAVPNDPETMFVTSGVRLGSPAVTSRGMGVKEMEAIANAITKILKNPDDEKTKEEVKQTVADLCRQFPLYSGMRQSLGVR